MFPCRSLFRLFVTFSILCCFLVGILLALISLSADFSTNTEMYDKHVFYGNALLGKERYFADSITSFTSRLLKEFEYKEKLASLTGTEIENLSSFHYRNVTAQWGGRRLLPTTKPMFHEKCLDYLDTNYDVTVSIVIPFHNELSVLLMRLLTTIMHRTLPKYLEEIILIDDASTLNISSEIHEYAQKQDIPLRFLFNKVKLGVPNSRRKGIFAANGAVVVILDSHMEVSELWLEPLLKTLIHSPKAVAVPHIHMISEEDYDELSEILSVPYLVKPRYGHGIITFAYLEEDKNSTRSVWEPYPSPGLLGGAVAALKSTFEEFYPEGVIGNSWSVENTRMSFRMWMCGDGIWVSPCSQVLHPNGNDVNLERYFTPGSADLMSELMIENAAELMNFMNTDTERENLIYKVTDGESRNMIWNIADEIRASFDPDRHHCKTYDYYRDHVFGNYHSWESDQFSFVGEVKSVRSPNLCLECADLLVKIYACRNTDPNISDSHIFGFTKNSQIRNGAQEFKCFDVSSQDDGAEVQIYGCHLSSPTLGSPYDSQLFKYNETTQQIVHLPSDRCLELILQPEEKVLLKKCVTGNSDQRWEIKTSPWF